MTDTPSIDVPFPRVRILTETYAQPSPNETPEARGDRLIEQSEKIVAALVKLAKKRVTKGQSSTRVKRVARLRTSM